MAKAKSTKVSTPDPKRVEVKWLASVHGLEPAAGDKRPTFYSALKDTTSSIHWASAALFIKQGFCEKVAS